MKKSKELHIFLDNQIVRDAIGHSTIMNNRHWLSPFDMRLLLQGIDADYNLVCRYVPDTYAIRDGCFVSWLCIEGFLEIAEKIETGKKLWASIPLRYDKRVNGKVSTSDYD